MHTVTWVDVGALGEVRDELQMAVLEPVCVRVCGAYDVCVR